MAKKSKSDGEEQIQEEETKESQSTSEPAAISEQPVYRKLTEEQEQQCVADIWKSRNSMIRDSQIKEAIRQFPHVQSLVDEIALLKKQLADKK